MWDRVRKISGKNICPPKQYLNGENGTTITDPKYIANEHAAVFTDNSSSAHYSATFQAIKEQEKRVKTDFTSDNTEVYNKPFRLRDLRWSISKAKPRAPGPDGINTNLLKHLPEDTLKTLKEILNKIWISADFPKQWRATTVIPIPKPNKDHTDPLSYRPIALTSCLCKVLEHVTCFGLKIIELPSCIAKDIFKALFVDDLAICFRGRSLDTIERHLQQAVNAIHEWATRNGFRFAPHKCKVIHFTAPRSRAQRPPIVMIGNTLLPVEESTKFLGLWWDSHLSFKKHISVLKTQCKEALNLIRVLVRGR